MASPFRVFRKNVKPLLVVFGCLLILAWVGGSSLTTMMSGSRSGGAGDQIRSGKAVAASWEGGSVTNQELESLVVRRAIVRAVLDQVEGTGAQSSLMAGLDPPPLRIMALRLPENAQQGVERSVLQTKLFANAAREAGMTVDDNAIVQYLLELGRGRVTKEDLRAILDGLRANNPRISVDYVFDGLRDELLARNFLMSNMFAAQTVTPQQRWQDWLQVNDRVVAEAAALPVETYLVDVKDPTDAELQTFFDEFKENEAGPDLLGDMELPSSRPGFRMPRKIGVQFLQANFNELVSKTEAEVTEEEIAKYYDENKELFIKADTGLLEDEPAVQDAPKAGAPATESAPADETGAGETEAATTDANADEESDAATEPEGDKEAEGAAAPESPADPTPPTPPAETPPATSEGTEKTVPADGDQSKTNRSNARNVFHQVAFLQGEEASSEAAESTPAAETAPADEATPPTEDAPATEAPAASEPTPPSAPPAATAEPAATSDAGTAPALTPPATTPPTAEKPKAYQPLDEVRDLIRRELAYQRANEKIGLMMEEVLGDVTKEFNAYFDKVLSSQSSEGERPAPQAALTDLAPLAAKYGLTVGKVDPEAWLKFRETPVGKSVDPDTRLPLSSILFGPTDRELYQPVLTVSIGDGDRYIAMKTSDTPSRIPELKDVRDEVVRAWKLREAAKLALKDAEKQAQEAQKAGSSLVDFYASKPAVQVEKVDPFSYLTRGDVPQGYNMQRFRLSQPDGIVAAGPELLGKVFDLKDGGVGAALNHDHSIAYVIRVVEHQDSPETLRAAYLAEANTWDGLPAMTERHVADARNSIVANLTGGKGVEWKRDPDKFGGNADTAE